MGAAVFSAVAILLAVVVLVVVLVVVVVGGGVCGVCGYRNGLNPDEGGKNSYLAR